MQPADLIFLKAVLEDVLHNQAASLTKGDIMPHAAERLVHELHNLWRRIGPTEFEQLLPHMAGVAMDDRLWNAA